MDVQVNNPPAYVALVVTWTRDWRTIRRLKIILMLCAFSPSIGSKQRSAGAISAHQNIKTQYLAPHERNDFRSRFSTCRSDYLSHLIDIQRPCKSKLGVSEQEQPYLTLATQGRFTQGRRGGPYFTFHHWLPPLRSQLLPIGPNNHLC